MSNRKKLGGIMSLKKNGIKVIYTKLSKALLFLAIVLQSLTGNYVLAVTLATPSLSSPSNGSTGIPYTNYNFSWSSISGATSYRIVVSESSSFSNFDDTSTSTSTCTNTDTCRTDRATTNSYSSFSLKPNTTYYWKVRAGSATAVASAWSSTYSFKTSQSPTNGQCGTAHGKTYPSSTTSYGSDSQCLLGSSNNTSFPSSGSSVSWSCTGTNGGSSASCSASRSTAPINQPPNLVSAPTNASTINSGGSITFYSTWNDPESKLIVDVKVRYRLQGSSTWNQNVMGYNSGYNFSKTITVIDAGTYEYEVQASDADTPDGTRTNTTNWLTGGTFTVKQASTNGQCGNASGKTYPSSTTSYGSDSQCSAGSSTNTSFPSAGSSVSWYCSGVNGGSSSNSCSALRSQDSFVTNQPPSLVTYSIHQPTFAGDVNISSTWNDPESKFIVDVKFRYRMQGGSDWTEVILNHQSGYTFIRTIYVTEPGLYEFQFQASDADVPDGIRTNTTNWISYNSITFSISQSPTNGQCGNASGKTYPSSTTSYGSDSQCSAGNSSNNSFPSVGSSVNWSCSGTNGGSSSSSCSSSRSTAQIVTNQPPSLVSASTSASTINSGGSITFYSTWNDPENKSIVDVTVQYRIQGTSTWTPIILNYDSGVSFSRTITISEPGTYEYQLKASDADTPSGTRTNTTSWLAGGTFTVNPIRINGQCGTADKKVYPYASTSYGTEKQCSAGSSSNTSFPSAGGSVSWSCVGTNGGSSASCSASQVSNKIPAITLNLVNPQSSIKETELTFSIELDSPLPAGYKALIAFSDGDSFTVGGWTDNKEMLPGNGVTFSYKRVIEKAGNKKYRVAIFKDSTQVTNWQEGDFTVIEPKIEIIEVLDASKSCPDDDHTNCLIKNNSLPVANPLKIKFKVTGNNLGSLSINWYGDSDHNNQVSNINLDANPTNNVQEVERSYKYDLKDLEDDPKRWFRNKNITITAIAYGIKAGVTSNKDSRTINVYDFKAFNDRKFILSDDVVYKNTITLGDTISIVSKWQKPSDTVINKVEMHFKYTETGNWIKGGDYPINGDLTSNVSINTSTELPELVNYYEFEFNAIGNYNGKPMESGWVRGGSIKLEPKMEDIVKLKSIFAPSNVKNSEPLRIKAIWETGNYRIKQVKFRFRKDNGDWDDSIVINNPNNVGEYIISAESLPEIYVGYYDYQFKAVLTNGQETAWLAAEKIRIVNQSFVTQFNPGDIKLDDIIDTSGGGSLSQGSDTNPYKDLIINKKEDFSEALSELLLLQKNLPKDTSDADLAKYLDIKDSLEKTIKILNYILDNDPYFISIIESLEKTNPNDAIEDLNILSKNIVDAISEFDPSITDDEKLQISSIILDLLPIVGDIKAGAQTGTGYDLLTNEKVNRFIEFISVAVSVPTAGIGGRVVKVAKVVSKLDDLKVVKNIYKKLNPDQLKYFLSIVKKGFAFETEIYTIGEKIPGFIFKKQVYLIDNLGKAPYRKVDGYIKGKAIFSMKATQFNEVKASTVEGYIKEAYAKYRPGTEIKSVKTGNNVNLSGKLEGQLYLLVPDQNDVALLEKFREIAKSYDIEIITKTEFSSLF